MNWQATLFWLSTAFFFGLGGIGWVIYAVARRSPRYHPALSFAGTAIGLLPAYLLLLRVLTALRAVPAPVTVWHYLALAVVTGAGCVAGVLTVVYIVVGNREYRRERTVARVGVP